MTFVKVQDPTNKNLVKEYIAKRNRVREADRRDKMGQVFEFEELSRFFKPVSAQTQELTKQVGELPGKIARAMPKPQAREEAPPPAYDTLPFAGEDVVPGEAEYETIDFPKEVQQVDDKVFRLGGINLLIDTNEKKIFLKKVDGDVKELDITPNIYSLLTNKNAAIQWNDLTPEEQTIYGKLLIKSGAMKSATKLNTVNRSIFNTRGNKWNNLYSHVWYNRWLFEDDFTDQEYNKMLELVNKRNYNSKTTQETRDKIREVIKQQFGTGVKTDYVTLPSDPNELVERLEILLASKDAGNTGVHNEIVSICEELRKRKMLTRAQYKQLLSNN